MKWIKSLRTGRIFYRILALILCLTGLMLLMTFVFFQQYISKSYQRRSQESARQMLSTASQYVDLAALDTARSMQQLLWNENLSAAVLVPDEVSYQRKVAIARTLSTFVKENPLLEGASLLTYGTNTLYDEDGKIEDIANSEHRIFLKEYNESVQEKLLQQDSFSTILLTVDGSVAILQPFPTPEKNGAMLVELREKELFRFLDKALEGTGDYLEVLDPAGTLLYTAGEPPKGGAQFLSVTGAEEWSFQVKSRNNYHPTAGQVFRLIAVWALAFGTVSIAAAVWITRRIYRPIDRLRANVTGQPKTVTHENELDQVQRIYEITRRQKDDLTNEVAEMAPIVRERLYKNLLTGRQMSREYLVDRLAYLHSSFGADDLFTVLVSDPCSRETDDPDQVMSELYRDILRQKQNGFSGGCHWECLLLDDYSMAMILCFTGGDDPALRQKGLLAITDMVQAQWRRHNGGSELLFGRSQPVRGAAGLSQAYRQACSDLHYRQYHGGKVPVQAQTEPDCRALLDKARNGALEQATGELETLLHSLKPLDADRRRSAYADILGRMAQLLVDLHANEEKMQIFANYYRAAEHTDTHQLETLMRTASAAALRLIADYGQRSRSRYVSQAQKYIQEHCTDSQLSLEATAHNVGINSAYLSRLFYEITGENFVNYTNGCRVECAKSLLRQSRISVQEIGFCCGFNSMQNFSRVFKRHTGMTPGNYRRLSDSVVMEEPET